MPFGVKRRRLSWPRRFRREIKRSLFRDTGLRCYRSPSVYLLLLLLLLTRVEIPPFEESATKDTIVVTEPFARSGLPPRLVPNPLNPFSSRMTQMTFVGHERRFIVVNCTRVSPNCRPSANNYPSLEIARASSCRVSLSFLPPSVSFRHHVLSLSLSLPLSFCFSPSRA